MKNNVLIIILAITSLVFCGLFIATQVELKKRSIYKFTINDVIAVQDNAYVVGFQVGRRTDLTHKEGYKNIGTASVDFVDYVLND